MTKKELRKKYKILRNNLSIENIDDLSISIANQLLKLSIWEHTFYHIFLSIEEQKEVNTDYILNILSGKDKNIVIPKSDFKTGDLTNYLLTDNTVIKKNDYNIPEPIDGIEISNDKIEIIFIPLLAFDKSGNRVGYGKGFYDRFLANCKPEAIKIGLSFFESEEIIFDIFENDIKLNYSITPKHIYKFV
ncbi:5-formyltetrahydrofolate cyclo-ligase [Flavivirga aquatica]|uniref:5-formyltetrahydrofolate cyclo-ligase n=1 Tax=Flavivirga aquatica TaxID=1849968 RepID=A0A1E5TDE3_9FLAO|nr:5-formyltetrahydrofolate cyclo-ligase [Flavivirga aquatica]OEK09368.1 5-formyltetrahydrofolate cyclo-ligase [Flavivirga aquatica]